ncbi:MAG: hypothetical protein IJ491_02740 [Clostridia bacterium]|nr:hypothetical protein [Clostridia bacterium]
MKKKLVAVVLTVVMLFSVTAVPASAIDFERTDSPFTVVLAKTIEWVFGALVKGLGSVMNENDSFIAEEDYSYDNFYEGTGEFIESASADAKWSLGSASLSLVPENWEEYDLYLGGFMSEQNLFTNDLREILDDMKVRVVAMNDGSGRGTTVFATIDAIGVANSDIRVIRGMLADFAEANDISSINLFSTHSHSCIDTQGLWTDLFGKLPFNLVNSITGLGELQQGTDPEYMEFFYDKVKTAIENAVLDMEEGTMTYASKDIGEEYFKNKNRPSADSMETDLKRFTFTPDAASSTPTIILNMAAHPDVVGLATAGDPTKGHGLSGDYIYYIGEVINNAGYDFMFFNGAICGIYTQGIDVEAEKRVNTAANYGREIGKMTLGLTMSQAEIEADDYLMSLNFTEEETAGHMYTPWYEGWEAATETEVEPILNVALKTVEVELTNPVMQLAGKLGIFSYQIKKVDKKYYMTTEIGYIEMGKDIRIAMVPGELCADLVYGGSSLTADGSVDGKDFEGKTLCEIFGEDVIVFGLANDACGYIVPDNDYCLALAFGHYQELISLGDKTASTLMAAYEELAAEVA